MITIIKKIYLSLLDFFFPSHCMSCGRAVEGGKKVCNECEKEIEKIEVRICKKCGMPEKRCDCNRYVYHFAGVCAPFFNEGIARKGLYKIKFSGIKQLVPYYAEAMIESLYKNFGDTKFDAVVFVPTNFIKGARRGYNQAEWLAEYISSRLGIPLFDKTLKRRVFSKTQHKSKSVARRFINAYKSYEKNKHLNGGTYLLIDDIKTTGASLDACSRQLLYAGADEVFCLTALIGNNR